MPATGIDNCPAAPPGGDGDGPGTGSGLVGSGVGSDPICGEIVSVLSGARVGGGVGDGSLVPTSSGANVAGVGGYAGVEARLRDALRRHVSATV